MKNYAKTGGLLAIEKAAHKKNGLVIKTDKFNIIKVADQNIVGFNLVKQNIVCAHRQQQPHPVHQGVGAYEKLHLDDAPDLGT